MICPSCKSERFVVKNGKPVCKMCGEVYAGSDADELLKILNARKKKITKLIVNMILFLISGIALIICGRILKKYDHSFLGWVSAVLGGISLLIVVMGSFPALNEARKGNEPVTTGTTSPMQNLGLLLVIGVVCCAMFIPTASVSSPRSTRSSSSYSSSSSGSSRTCAHRGCTRKAVTSGDSIYCSTHSNRCLNCGKYIDEDAMYCMSCLSKALGGK